MIWDTKTLMWRLCSDHGHISSSPVKDGIWKKVVLLQILSDLIHVPQPSMKNIRMPSKVLDEIT